jgi:hypothetical protein
MKIVALVLAIAFFAVAVLYWTGIFGGVHVKHGVLFAGLGVLALIWLRFQSGSPTRAR